MGVNVGYWLMRGALWFMPSEIKIENILFISIGLRFCGWFLLGVGGFSLLKILHFRKEIFVSLLFKTLKFGNVEGIGNRFIRLIEAAINFFQNY